MTKGNNKVAAATTGGVSELLRRKEGLCIVIEYGYGHQQGRNKVFRKERTSCARRDKVKNNLETLQTTKKWNARQRAVPRFLGH